MKVSLATALRLWLAYRYHPWVRPKAGWLFWLLFGRRVGELADPVCEGSVNDGRQAPEWAPTVKAAVMEAGT